MKKVTTILCCIAFMISGIMMAITGSGQSPGTGYKTMAAATLQNTQLKVYEPEEFVAIPEYSGKKLEERVLDTVYITKTDTIKEQVTKVKWRKAPAPEPVVVRDTIRETHYYLATQVGNKEGPTGECIPIYEIHKVDEICPETINSSVIHAPQHECDVGD